MTCHCGVKHTYGFTPIVAHALCDACGVVFTNGDTCMYVDMVPHRPQGRAYFIHASCFNGDVHTQWGENVTLK